LEATPSSWRRLVWWYWFTFELRSRRAKTRATNRWTGAPRRPQHSGAGPGGAWRTAKPAEHAEAAGRWPKSSPLVANELGADVQPARATAMRQRCTTAREIPARYPTRRSRKPRPPAEAASTGSPPRRRAAAGQERTARAEPSCPRPFYLGGAGSRQPASEDGELGKLRDGRGRRSATPGG